MLKNYRYISDTKLDMLSAQIPRGLRSKIAAELAINVQVFSITLKEQPSDDTRYSKLDLVVDYIEKHEPVGTVDAPQDFFKGRLQLHWGPIGRAEHDIIYFGSNLPNLTLGLVGSRHHTIGGSGTAARGISPSIDYMMLLPAHVEVPPSTVETHGLEEQYRRFGWVMDHINDALEQDRPPEDLEFLAVRLLRWPAESDATTDHEGGGLTQQKPFLLGSPIYVARAGG